MGHERVDVQARHFALGMVVIIIGVMGIVNLAQGALEFVEIHCFATPVEVHYVKTNFKKSNVMLLGRSQNKVVQSYQASVIVSYISPETGEEKKAIIDYYNVAEDEEESVHEAYWYSDDAPIITKEGMEYTLVGGSLMLLPAVLFFSIDRWKSKKKIGFK